MKDKNRRFVAVWRHFLRKNPELLQKFKEEKEDLLEALNFAVDDLKKE